jgi:hypothetical protein
VRKCAPHSQRGKSLGFDIPDINIMKTILAFENRSH